MKSTPQRIIKILICKSPTTAQNMNRQSKMFPLSNEKFALLKQDFQEETSIFGHFF